MLGVATQSSVDALARGGEGKQLYAQADFDPFDPLSKYNEQHYLSGLENLKIDMQMSSIQIKTWATLEAKQILKELEERTIVRDRAFQLIEKKFTSLQNKQKDQFDEFEFIQRRLEYWDYLRQGIQLVCFQNQVLNLIIKLKQKEVLRETVKFKHQDNHTDMLYFQVAKLEQPIEE